MLWWNFPNNRVLVGRLTCPRVSSNRYRRVTGFLVYSRKRWVGERCVMPCWVDVKKRVLFTAIVAVLVLYQWSAWAAEPPEFLDNRLINPLDRTSGTP